MSVPPLTTIVCSPTTFSCARSTSLEADGAVAGVEGATRGWLIAIDDVAHLPSSSKKKEGSIPPTVGSRMGSDHGPAGFLAVT